MAEELPVTVAVRKDGRTEHVKVGTATRTADGWSLQLGELTIGSSYAPAEAPRARAASSGGAAAGGGDGMVFPNYGRSKGAPILGATMSDLEFYRNGAMRSLGDPGKERFHAKERQLLAAIDAEVARQGGGGGDSGGGGGHGEEPPPPGDEDAPF